MRIRIIAITIATSFLFSSIQSYGQTSKVSHMDFGFFICPNFSSLKTVNSAITKGYQTEKGGSVTGFGFGGIMDYNFSKNYFLSTGLNVMGEGGKLNIKSTDSTNRNLYDLKSGTISYKMQYLEIPLTIKMTTNPTANLPITVYADMGFQIGVTISKRAKMNDVQLYGAPGVTNSSDYDKISGLSVSPAAFGMNLGAGVFYTLNPELKLMFGLRFTNYFLPDITNPQKGIAYAPINGAEVKFDDGKQRLNGFQVRIGLMF